MYDISSSATYYFRKSGFKSVNSKKLPEIAKAFEVKKRIIHFLCEKVSMLFLLQVPKCFFSLIKVLMYLLIFRFLIKKCTTLLTMYFKYKTALQPCSLTILITYFALIRLPTGTTKYVRMCQLEDCVLQNCLNFALKGSRIKN